ncbi:MAG: hypothetical protein ABIA37_03510 [Candidatus Woesearchaeota archaeon]
MDKAFPDEQERVIDNIADALTIIYLKVFGEDRIDIAKEHALEIYAHILEGKYHLDLENIDHLSLGKILMDDPNSQLSLMQEAYVEKGQTKLDTLHKTSYKVAQRRRRITEQVTPYLDAPSLAEEQPQAENFKDYLKNQLEQIKVHLDTLSEKVEQQVPYQETHITQINNEVVIEQVQKMEEIVQKLSQLEELPISLSAEDRSYLENQSNSIITANTQEIKKKLEERSKSMSKKVFSWLALGFAATFSLGGYLGYRLSETRSGLDQHISSLEQRIGQRDKDLVSEIENRYKIKVKIIESMLKEEVDKQVKKLQENTEEVTTTYLKPVEEPKRKVKTALPKKNRDTSGLLKGE